MNAVLERLHEQRQAQVTFVDETLARVDADGRDLVEAEQANLSAARQRIAELDAQISPLEEFESVREAHAQASAPIVARRRAIEGLVDGDPRQYASAGSFLVDLLSARGFMQDRQTGRRLPADPEAERRIAFALANQTTADTPGLLPHPIVGQVVSLIDASRPFITSIGGGRPMGGIPGKTFGRPKVTQHTAAGTQSTEKAELTTQKMVISEIPFTKATYGGAVDVSRQDIDWSSPAAWDILIRDLADVYSVTTELNASAGMWTASDDVNAATAVPTGNTLASWSAALYAAASLVYATAKRLPNRIWCSVDVWALLGPLTDLSANPGQAGDSNLDTFAGNLFRLPRIVVPNWGTGRCVIGVDSAYEVYEEVIGLLTAVEPSLLGVEVAYGGYMAHAAVFAEGLARITPFGVTPTILREGEEEADQESEGDGRRKARS